MSDSIRHIDTGTNELLCELRGRVATITLNRPEAHNALSSRLSPALQAMIRYCANDDAVGALLLTGAGNSFCAGGDIKAMGDYNPKRAMSRTERIVDLRDRQRMLTGALASFPKPTIAALPGVAVGGGLAIALACDIRIAAESAFVTTGYCRIGLAGDYGITPLLTRLVGTGRARELMFIGDRVSAMRAESMGLVNRVVPDADLQAEAFTLAHRLANGPSQTLRLMKDNLDDALVLDFKAALDREAERLIESADTADHAEAVRAFIEKREPVFTGR